MLKRFLFLLVLFLLVFVPKAFAGGPNNFEVQVTPSGVLQAPGSEYVVNATVFSDQDHTVPAKGWPVTFRLQNPQGNDYIAPSASTTGDDGRVYAKIISNVQGSRVIIVETTAPNGFVLESTPMALSYTGNTPFEQNHSIAWITPYAYLRADNFYVDIKGKKDYITGGVYYIKSQPTTAQNPNTTNLEVDATHDGEDSKIIFTFTYTPGQFWKLSEVKYMTTGLSPADWIVFNPTDQNGNSIQHSLGQTYLNSGTVELSAKELGGSKIHMEGVKMRGFPLDYASAATNTKPISSPTPTSYSQMNPSITSANTMNNELNKKVSDLENKLAESQQKQSVLEERFNSLLSWLKSHLPFLR